jgi:glycosyltransferase involved in cell wall biosynthesis
LPRGRRTTCIAPHRESQFSPTPPLSCPAQYRVFATKAQNSAFFRRCSRPLSRHAAAVRPRRPDAGYGRCSARAVRTGGRPFADGRRLTLRLGIYVDAVYSVTETEGDRRVSADPVDSAFLIFAAEVGRAFERVVFLGRTVRAETPRQYLPLIGVDIIELPYYRSLREIRDVTRASPATIWTFWRALRRLDVVWVFGPHPFALVLVFLAAIQKKRVILGVRQDTVAYYRGRLPSRRWSPALLLAHALDASYRALASSVRTTVVGREIARRYGDRASVLPMTVSVVRAADVVDSPPLREWAGTIGLLAVGRIEPEKNPLLLIEALAALEREQPGRFRLTWLGDGQLRETVRQRAIELQISHIVDLRGFIPFGPELLGAYRSAHIFVHVSLTEGVPQVLMEALASGTPVVATDVGGVRAALDHGDAGLLVPPRDSNAVVQAISTIVDDVELRDRLVVRGLAVARGHTRETEAARVARFIQA